VDLTGAASASTTTDANGNYSFGSLANGSYTLTPSKASYSFSPASIAVTVNGGNVTGQNFTATAVCSPENWRSWNPLPSLVGGRCRDHAGQICLPDGATLFLPTASRLGAKRNGLRHPTPPGQNCRPVTVAAG
jgi:hypothetical protein